jgi:hypothetical protein
MTMTLQIKYKQYCMTGNNEMNIGLQTLGQAVICIKKVVIFLDMLVYLTFERLFLQQNNLRQSI